MGGVKAALQAKKARGEKLGNPEHLMDKHEQAIAKSNQTNSDKAKNNPNNKRAVAFLKVMILQEKSLQEMSISVLIVSLKSTLFQMMF